MSWGTVTRFDSCPFWVNLAAIISCALGAKGLQKFFETRASSQSQASPPAASPQSAQPLFHEDQ